jgi:ferredoxin-NADP reductase
VRAGGHDRRYSLCSAADTGRSQKRDAAGRAARSAWSTTRRRRTAAVAEPRNEFALHPRAKRLLFIAGGIASRR